MQLCADGERPVYIGETSRNLYTQGKDHMGSEQREGTDEREAGYVFSGL